MSADPPGVSLLPGGDPKSGGSGSHLYLADCSRGARPLSDTGNSVGCVGTDIDGDGEISVKRLEARPETTLCIRWKEDQEHAEKDYG